MSAVAVAPWYDRHAAGENLRKLLEGRTVTVTGDAELGQADGFTFAVSRVFAVVAGIDSRGPFAGFEVTCTHGVDYTLYVSGTVADEDDVTLGRYTL